MISVTRTVAPASAIINEIEAKRDLRITHEDDDVQIRRLCQAASDLIEERVGQALVTQTLRATSGNGLTGRALMRVPLYGPSLTITSVQYYDTANALQSATLADFEVQDGGDRAASYFAPIKGASWPNAFDRLDAIRVTYTAGYAEALSVPSPLRTAALMLVQHWFAGAEAEDIPAAVDMLIAPYKRRWFAS